MGVHLHRKKVSCAIGVTIGKNVRHRMEPIHIFKLKLNKNEIQALKALLSKPSNRRNKSLKSIFDRLDGEDEITLYIDGAADLHSKTAGIGGVIYRNKDELFSFSEYLDDATNNEAEYTALIRGIEHLIALSQFSVQIYSDSELVVKQINGEYRVKNQRMQNLYQQAMQLLNKLDQYSVTHILRDKNTVADKLANVGRAMGKK